MKKQLTAIAAATGLALTAFAGSADAQGKPAGIECQQSGIATLQEAGLLSAVAADGLTVGDAVALEVTPRDGLPEGVTLDTVLSFSTILADHRAGSDSIFVYPWCES